MKLQFSQILCFACSRQGTAIVKSEKFECCQIFCCTGMVTVSLAVKCYVCGLSADCNDEYSGVQGHLVDCTNSQDGGCTKTKTITKLPGGVITTVGEYRFLYIFFIYPYIDPIVLLSVSNVDDIYG